MISCVDILGFAQRELPFVLCFQTKCAREGKIFFESPNFQIKLRERQRDGCQRISSGRRDCGMFKW